MPRIPILEEETGHACEPYGVRGEPASRHEHRQGHCLTMYVIVFFSDQHHGFRDESGRRGSGEGGSGRIVSPRRKERVCLIGHYIPSYITMIFSLSKKTKKDGSIDRSSKEALRWDSRFPSTSSQPATAWEESPSSMRSSRGRPGSRISRGFR